jgi:hypothetical protein
VTTLPLPLPRRCPMRLQHAPKHSGNI